MAILLTAVTGRLMGESGRRGNIAAVAVLIAAILVGGGLALWARLGLNAVLEIREHAEIAISVDKLSEDCGTPALYVLPAPSGAGSDYRVLLDALGGRNRFPDLGGNVATSVLSLPDSRRPGVGLGRGLLERCEGVSFTIEGNFADIQQQQVNAFEVFRAGSGSLQLAYRRTENPDEADALAAFTLLGVSDAWQFGHKRVRFANAGGHGVNVFLYEEPDFLFLNENFSLVRPPNVPRSYADIHLEMMGGVFASVADVVRRRPTSDLELQSQLMNLSTMFGIGISLLVEGMLLVMISLAAGFSTGSDRVPKRRPSQRRPAIQSKERKATGRRTAK